MMQQIPICLLCLFASFVDAQSTTITNITLGSSLAAGNESSWLSPSGDFAFGFQPVGTGSGYLLAIWFNKIPDKTITWSANRNVLAPHGSKLQLTADGGLVLTDPSGSVVWRPQASSSGVAFADMLDTGNLVLKDENSGILWQSFDFPTDTILPTQVLMNKGDALVSRVSETDYSSGKFQLIMQGDGNLVFYLLNWPEDLLQYNFYDASSTVGSGYQLVFNQSGSIYILAKNGSVVYQVLSNNYRKPAEDVYQRAILEFDGVFRKYVYPRSNSTSSPRMWTMQDFRPENICSHAFNSGGGICGFNSICLGGDDAYKRPKCVCPQSYSYSDESNHMKGCKPEFAPQSCTEDSPPSRNQFQLIEMPDIDFPGPDLDKFQDFSDTSCRESCLSDCLCAAVVIGENCWKKGSSFANGQLVEVNLDGSIIRPRAFIKVPIGNSTSTDPILQPIGVEGHKEMGTVIITESVFLGGSVLLNVVLLLTLAVLTKILCTKKRKAKPSWESQDIAGTNIRSFSYRELEEATNGFKEVVGQGAFATVYKGLLDSEEGTFVAVKKLNETVKDNQREFEREVKAISRTGHRNLVRLIGFCNEGQHRLLVYEYMPNGSLADVISQDQRPNWSRRIKFALETARGLSYLHEECSIQIIHCDIKLQNVLLDDSFTVRISDFGLAKLLRKDQVHTMTGIRGTKGYVAPEWFKSVPITTKVDVYSYGILLLELICCRRCFEAEIEDESQMVLADWAFDCYHEGRTDKLVEGDDQLVAADRESIKKFVMIALRCIQDDPSLRPSMNKVVQMIKEALEESQDVEPHVGPMSIAYGHSQPSIRY